MFAFFFLSVPGGGEKKKKNFFFFEEGVGLRWGKKKKNRIPLRFFFGKGNGMACVWWQHICKHVVIFFSGGASWGFLSFL